VRGALFFARALAESIRARAKGIDDDSARIVNTRPQEHVLSGFLTPAALGEFGLAHVVHQSNPEARKAEASFIRHKGADIGDP
jgi:hypothetical protein